MEQNETFDVELDLGSGLRAVMTIKKQMTGLEFFGLMKKAKQLFDISNKEVVEVGVVSQHRAERRIWTDESIAALKRCFVTKDKKYGRQELLDDPIFQGRTYKQIWQKAYTLGFIKTNSPSVKTKVRPW